MKSKAKTVEECTTLFEIEISKEAIAKAFEEVYNEIVKIANIPGFRVGRAPKELVKKHYAKDAREEVLKRLIPEAYRAAVEEHKIDPMGLPEISEVKFDDTNPLIFKAKVSTRPDFKLKNYKGIAIEKKAAQVTADELDSTLKKMQEMYAKFHAVSDRALQMGDYAVSDLECFVDGKSAHKKRENLWLYLDKESLALGLSEKMVGMKANDEADIDVVLPEKYPDKNLAGKSARYHVKVKEIKVRQLPNIDDEFAKDLGKKDLAELRQEISKELAERHKASQEADMESQLLNKLIDDNVFGVPANLVARQLDYMVEDAKARLFEKGFKKEDLDKKDKEFKEKFKNDALRRIRLLFMLNAIAEQEKISVTDEDIKDAYKLISVQTGKPEDEVKKYYGQAGRASDLEEKLREGRTIDFLLKEAKVTEAEK